MPAPLHPAAVRRRPARSGHGALAVLVAVLAGFGGARAGEPVRVWTSLDGRRLDAALVEARGDRVRVQVPSGGEVTLALEKLSDADRAYVGRWMKAAEEAIWPAEAKARAGEGIAVVREDDDGKAFVYRSEHFEFVADIRMSKSVVLEFSRVFESTHAALSALPLGHRLRPPEGTSHFRTRVFRTREEYFSAGGFPGSAGLYVGETGEVLIPLSSLGVRVVGRRVVLDRAEGHGTLIHELVHQLAASDQQHVPVWYREGIADYLASCPYRSGRFSFENRARSVIDFLRRTPPLVLPPLQDLLAFGREQFYGANDGLGDEARRNYAAALVLVTFFFHLDGGGDAARIKAYLGALDSGRAADAALGILLDGRSPEDLQRELQSAWLDAGLPLEFRGGSPAPGPKFSP